MLEESLAFWEATDERRGHVKVFDAEVGLDRIAGHNEGGDRRPEVRRAERERIDVLSAIIHARDVIGHAPPNMIAALGDKRSHHRMVVHEPRRLCRVAAS